ncbi:DUF229 domain-containing protein [candidate division KSB1 bacterium]|nr:sulfatase-like hydrolase/transferase [candidate division KSB1 bacterium]RQW03753.1 MAG: DUF229 domain-containing protein [candidate division KSB1 bacterium]
MNRRQFIKNATTVLASTTVLGTMASCSQKKNRPNILWLTAEDMSPVLRCYGDQYAYTPHLDKLAAEGVRYSRCFANAPLCTPARSSIITGLFASSLGTQHLRGFMPLAPQIKGYPEYLRQAGYYCTNNVKEDYNFVTPESFWDESSETAHWRKRPEGRPFFAIFNFMTTHQSRTRYEGKEFDGVNAELSPQERHDPAQAPLPPYYPDTPRVRTNIAAFYNQVTLMDKQVGEILQQLEEDGLVEETIVFFYADHGSGLPRGKRWLFTTGLHVPLIIRCPEKYRHLLPNEPGATSDELVSFVDFPATVLSLADIKPPAFWHGQAFLGKYKTAPRTEVYAIRDRVDEVLEMSRTIIDGDWQYIRNFFPHRPRMQRSFYSEMTPIRQELRRLHKAGQLKDEQAWLMSQTKPAEELYNLKQDYLGMHNLADQEAYADRVKTMHDKLYAWMLETRDLSLLHETDMIHRAKGKMPYEFAHDDAVYPIAKILRVADMVGRGPDYVEDLKVALSDDDSAVRYWAATALAAMGSKAMPARAELQKALNDEWPWVRFAAAEACCSIGLEYEAVQILAAGLMKRDIITNLHAAEILVVIDEKARPAIPHMKQAIQKAEGLPDHGWYMREALLWLVDKLET